MELKLKSAATTWCRACSGTGDFFDGQDYYTCGTCGGSGEHSVDRSAYGVIGDGVEAFYEPPSGPPLADTTELPLIRLLPPVPPSSHLPERRPRRRLKVQRYGWFVGLLLAGLFFYVQMLPVQLPGWLLVAAVIWMAVAVPVAFVIGLGIRIADERDGIR